MKEVFEKIREKIKDYLKDKIIEDGWDIVDFNANISNVIYQVEQEYNDGWIPCSERLPEESLNSVIGWDEHRKRCCFVQYYGGRWILGNDIESVKIVAWQPLPPAYAENNDLVIRRKGELKRITLH